MPEIELFIENTPRVFITNREGDYYVVHPASQGFVPLKQLVYQALTAERGVDRDAQGVTREHPVYLEVPDSSVQSAPTLGTLGRVRLGAISPDNPHYAALAKMVGDFVPFPETVQPASSLPQIAEDTISSDIRSDPDYAAAKQQLLQWIGNKQEFMATGHMHPQDKMREEMFLDEAVYSPQRRIEQGLKKIKQDRANSSLPHNKT